ncbi:twin-arginine translocation pathway signal protein [Thermus tengchongensis]|uniref:Twin-arginine translocation pathway signal protein n=1 Tax=Thermus tengchongensis TaxID=1214928 RepID=A0ABY2K930_9DEIN|nr:twin-arginine translocation pathway signal protein [Thermus tengchongensis]
MVNRRRLLKLLGTGSLLGALRPALAQTSAQAEEALPTFTGPGPNPYWNGVNPFVTYPQKLPLLRLTDRPVQLETPRHYFRTAFTPNEAFYVRYHLDEIPNEVDLTKWRLQVEGNVEKPLSLSFQDLVRNFTPVSIAAVNQCSGNSRSRFQPRVPGGQWGNGAMGNALWTGVRLKDLLKAAGVKPGTVQIQFEGLDRGRGPENLGSGRFLKSLDWDDPALDEAIVAYLMNGEPLPMLNGFPVRLVVPGKFATYWLKHLTWIRALTQEDKNFWMATAYRIPDTPNGSTTPEDVAAGKVKTVPIGKVNMPVRSFIVDPDGSYPLVVGLPAKVRGVAFSGHGKIVKVEVSLDGGQTWRQAALGPDYGKYSFRTYEFTWTPTAPGKYTLAVRATDEKGNVQPDTGVWNPGGYLWNKIERQEVVVIAAR